MQKYDFYCEEALSGKTPIKKVFESDTLLAFHHTKPSYPLHIVLVPKKHIPDFVSIEDQDLPFLLEVQKVVALIAKDRNLSKEGMKLITNMGTYQDTPHLHFHVISGARIHP